MVRSKTAQHFSLILGTLTMLTSCAWAQMTAVTEGTSTPIPGAGHDYIKMLSETVDPASGSVSVRMEVPAPPARGITTPFSFSYDSNGVHFPVGSSTPGEADWGTVEANATSVTALGGWSYSFPMLSYESVETVVVRGGNLPNCTYTGTGGFVFQDATGGRHSLSLGHADPPSPSSCSQNYLESDSASDDYYKAKLVGGVLPVIMDADGTVYTFSNADLSAINQMVSSVPSSIEDRNGNVLENGKDTLGRPAVSWTGFGATGNTVTVSGLTGSYNQTWGTATYYINPAQEASGAGAIDCSGINIAQGSQAVITAIALPNNGQPNGPQYQFSYDPTFGELSEIKYPTGGWVKYSWG